METGAGTTSFLFVGNKLCLDFVNTEVIAHGRRVSLIHRYADLKAWLLEAGVVNAAYLDTLEASWGGEEKAQIVRQALELRAVLRHMVAQIAAGQIVSEHVIDAINDRLELRKGYPILGRTNGDYAMRMCYEESSSALLAPIAESAADLLVHADRTRVRKCKNPQCILYFYDTSKNHARRWCSMDLCGNRMKVAAHYRRSLGAARDTAADEDLDTTTSPVV